MILQNTIRDGSNEIEIIRDPANDDAWLHSDTTVSVVANR